MKTRGLLIGACVGMLLAGVLGGCGMSPTQRKVATTGAGALGGYIYGNNNGNRTRNTAIGAGLGLISGYALDSVMTNVFCPQCGKRYENARYCPDCGVACQPMK